MLLDGAMAWLGAGLVRWGGSQRHAHPGSPMSSPRARAAHLASDWTWKKVASQRSFVKTRVHVTFFSTRATEAGSELICRLFRFPNLLLHFRSAFLLSLEGPGRRGGDDAAHHEAAPGTEAE